MTAKEASTTDLVRAEILWKSADALRGQIDGETLLANGLGDPNADSDLGRIVYAFRQWATSRLSEVLLKGFTMDDERLRFASGDGILESIFEDVSLEVRR